MQPAARAQPTEFFTPPEWERLCERSSWKGLALVAHCWLAVGAAIAMGVHWPITIPLAIMLVGNRQLGLFILMHDAAHGALHPNRKINDWVGKWLCGFDLHPYRAYHLKHHRFVQQDADPDLVLSAPFPISPTSLRRKVVRDLTGQTFYKQRVEPFFTQLKQRGSDTSVLTVVRRELSSNGMFWLGNAAGLAVFSALDLGSAWLAMWLLPMATWLPLISRIRNISEHALVAHNEPNPLKHARTTHTNWLGRMLIAPYWVNYHCEHHMFTHIACWKLPAAHILLARQGATQRMETQSGYLKVLRLATTPRAAH